MKKFFGLAVAIIASTFTFAQTLNEAQGTGSGVSITTGDYNTFYGDSSASSVSSGSLNTIIGFKAGFYQTSATDNVFIGAGAGGGTTTGTDNTVIGTRAGGWGATSPSAAGGTPTGALGTDNTVIGTEAGMVMEIGAADNTIIGEEAGQALTTGDDNVFIGEDAGFNSTTSSDNTFVGSASGRQNTTGYRNAFFGNEAGYDNTTGFWNTCIGDSSGIDNSTGYGNTFVGHAAGASTEYASNNTFIGNNSGWENNRTNATSGEGQRNTYLGSYTGYTNREGNDNIGIGAFADFISVGYTATDNRRITFIGNYTSVDEQDAIAIGYDADVYGRGTIGIGNYLGYESTDSDYAVGIGYLGYSRNANNTVALGREHYLTTADNSIAIGAYDSIVADYGMAIGYDAYSSGNYSSAFGYNSKVESDSSMVFGYGATIGSGLTNAFAIGTNATVTSSNALVLGSATEPVSVGIGTTAPNSNAALELADTDKGFLVNRLTTALRTTLGSSLTASDQGMMVYDTDIDAIYTWNGSSWNTVTNTDNQDLSLSGNTLSLTNDGTTVDLSAYLDNTDTQLTEAEVDAYVANNGYLTTFTEVDGDITNEIQDISLVGNNLAITSGSTVDLSGYLDNTDTQLTEAEVDAYVANNGYLTTFTEVDGDVTNEIQDISLSGTDLSISSGSTIDLSSIDTDTQLTEAEVDAYVANNGYLTTFTEVDGDVTNEIQDISLSGTNLSISSGSTVDLSTAITDTDDQTLSLAGTTLTIADGNSVDLATIDTDTDEQDLTAATLTGTILTIDIENGASVSVDLSPMLANIEAQLLDHETRITDLEACACDSTAGLWGGGDQSSETAILYQNIPNPFNNTSSIKYYIPSYANSANLVISNGMGQLVSNIEIDEVGEYGVAHVNADGLAAGTYYYTLYVNKTLIDTKKMVVE